MMMMMMCAMMIMTFMMMMMTFMMIMSMSMMLMILMCVTMSMHMHMIMLMCCANSQDKIGTSNSIVAESIRTGEPKGYDASNMAKPKSDAEIRCDQLTEQLAAAKMENAQLKKRVEELELTLRQYEGNPKARQAIDAARLTDSIVNGAADDLRSGEST